jgi:hypothetical protein
MLLPTKAAAQRSRAAIRELNSNRIDLCKAAILQAASVFA